MAFPLCCDGEHQIGVLGRGVQIDCRGGCKFHLAIGLDALGAASALVQSISKPVREDHLDIDVSRLTARTVILARQDGVPHLTIVERVVLADAGRTVHDRVSNARYTGTTGRDK